jgi:hypothetical protein
MPRPLTSFAILAILGTPVALASFETSYSYRLLEGRDVEVCRHMLRIYNDRFRKPWSDEAAKGSEYEAAGSWETYYSRHPSSPEFNAINWRLHRYKINESYARATSPALFAEFDIDNDGKKDLVMHVGFFTGSPGTRDQFWVFPSGAVVPSEFRTHEEFLKQIAEKRITVLDNPVHQRPFIYEGRTYMHAYEYTPRTYPGANPSEPFGPPEYLMISEYGGPNVDDWMYKNMRRGGLRKPICRYEMRQHG